MLANQLIDRLERLGLLDQEIIEALREQLEQGGTRVTPEAVAKLLVDNGQLTHFQATKLIGELRSGQYQDESASGAARGSDSDDLTVLPDEAEEIAEAEAVEVLEVHPVAVEAIPVQPVVVGTAVEEVSRAVPRDRPRTARKKPDAPKSVWDSFKVYGFLGIIVLLVLAGLFFVFVLGKESEDEFVAEANKLYDQRNFTAAQEYYMNFLATFGQDSQYSSLARTRVTMTELYKAAEFKQEPWRAVDLAKEKLPIIAQEPGMNEDRGNLAALLVDIAANLAASAGRAEATTEKQSLLEKLDEQRVLMEDPMYMPTAMKTSLASQIAQVEEARARVKREINRNNRLDESEASMNKSLEAKETKAAYDTRFQLLREFPELHNHERLVTLISKASEIQKTLVQPSAKLPESVTGESSSDATKSILLTTRSGRAAPDLQGETLYVRAGGSILAFDGENGQLRWRNFVGYAQELSPVRVEDGVLLSESASLEVLRCGAQDGKVAWRAHIGEAFSVPVAVGQDVYLSTAAGRLIALDATSGDAKWATQIPQPLETGPGVDERAGRAYLPGDHSNLYLLNTRDGSCLESFYIGHNQGTINVPPVPLLGHLFVIENAGSDYAKVHVLSFNETGEQLRIAQPAFRLIGNVRVKPVIQGRRLIALTDRGEVTVFDIEPTAEREQVTVAAKLSPFYEQPTPTQMAVGRSQMWITGTRLGRYELQINTGRVIRDWSKHELDTFIGEPYATEESLVHARVLRGTSAIRVTAADPKTGEEIWRTDVGVPVSMLIPAPGGKGFHAVTSQAALFELDRDSLSSGSTQGPIENPGDQAVAIRFENPIPIDPNRRLLLNQVDGQSIIVYEPQRDTGKLRQVTLQLSSGQPSGGGLVFDKYVFFPLDTGRAMLFEWRTGAAPVAPFQPASDPTGKVKWTNPIALPDDPGQVVLADSRKKIYRLRLGEQVRELASKDLEYEMLGDAAGVGDTMIATTSGPAADFIVGFELATLNEKFKMLLDGRVVWGPVAAADLCLLRTDDSQLRGFAADGTQKFAVELPAGVPAGQPITIGKSIVLAGRQGWIVAIDSASGQLLGQIDLGQPISATPLQVGTRLLVPGAEGVVYITDVPGQ